MEGTTQSGRKTPFLVVYDYGQGGVWGYVLARSSNQISARFPELTVVDEPPTWMDAARQRKHMEEREDIDGPYHALLKWIVDSRGGCDLTV